MNFIFSCYKQYFTTRKFISLCCCVIFSIFFILNTFVTLGIPYPTASVGVEFPNSSEAL